MGTLKVCHSFRLEGHVCAIPVACVTSESHRNCVWWNQKATWLVELALLFIGPGRASPVSRWTPQQEGWSWLSLESWPQQAGEITAPLLPTERTDLDGLDVGELALPPHLRRTAPVSLTGQLSYHSGPHPGLQDLLELGKGLVLWNNSHSISKTWGSRISQRRSGVVPVMTVDQKSEALNQTSDSLQWALASKGNWTQEYIFDIPLTHNGTGQSRGCWRGRKDGEVKRILFRPCFVCLLCWFLFWFDFLNYFLAVVTTGVQRVCRGTGKWMELGFMVWIS